MIGVEERGTARSGPVARTWPATRIGAKDYTPEIAKVNIRWKMPLSMFLGQFQ